MVHSIHVHTRKVSVRSLFPIPNEQEKVEREGYERYDNALSASHRKALNFRELNESLPDEVILFLLTTTCYENNDGYLNVLIDKK